MDSRTMTDSSEVANKIARLVEERGWNQEEFARITRLNRHTVRQILLSGDRRMRNATTSACARALGLSVNDLRTLPLEQLLSRARAADAAGNSDSRRRLREEATHPELIAWLEENPERARRLTADEASELLTLQGTADSLSAAGVGSFVDWLERRRSLMHRVTVITGTQYFDLLDQFVALLYEKVRPANDRH
jgi:transcriptional regulator with XRE-family HTH domain